MSRFTDNKKRTFVVTVDTNAIKRVRKELGLDLLEILTDKTVLQRVTGDPILLVDTLYLICQPQCEAENITDVDFGSALVGDVIDEAIDAFCEALVDFFPKTRRTILQKILQQIRTTEAKGFAMVSETIDGGALAELADRELAKAREEIASRLRSTNSGTLSTT